MKRQTKNNLRIFACGALSGTLILLTVNHYSGHIFKKDNNELKDEFSKPKFEQSFNDVKEVQQYSFDYYGKEIKIQGDSVKIHSVDEFGNEKVEEGKKVEVPIENNDYLLDEYISQKEAIVYKTLKNKDNIKDQFNVYLTFNLIKEVYEEYLNREPFDTLENRKEAIYKVCYDYIVSDNDYTMGGYKYNELEKTIQKDILKVYQNINYMKKNNKIEEKSKIENFVDTQKKVIKYELIRKGRK